MRNATGSLRESRHTDHAGVFRADVDHTGDWYVWRQLGANGWATLRRCKSREDARALAASMNHQNRHEFC